MPSGRFITRINDSNSLVKWSALLHTDHAWKNMSSPSVLIIKQKVCCHWQLTNNKAGVRGGPCISGLDRSPQGQTRRKIFMEMLCPTSPSILFSHRKDIIVNKTWSIWTNFEFGLQGFCFCCHKYITRAASQPYPVSQVMPLFYAYI